MTTVKDQLLAIAFDLFLAHGYDGVGLSEVVKAANTSKGALYHHFSSKEELIAQMLQRYFLDGFAEVDFDALAQHSAAAQLAMLTQSYQGIFGAEAAVLKYGLARYFALFFDSLGRNPAFADAIQSYYQKTEAALKPDVLPYLRQIEGEIYLATVHKRLPDFSFLPPKNGENCA